MHMMLALDQSRYADAIVKWMSAFPHPPGTRLTLAHIVEPLDVPEVFGAQGRNAIRREQLARAEALLSRAERLLSKAYSPIAAVMREGLPSYELLKLIRDEHPNVVVSGARGLRGVKGLALGSVSQRLLSYAACSVLLIPANAKPARNMKVVLATDGSRGAKTAARLLTIFSDIKEVTVMAAMRPIDARDLALQAADRSQFGTVRTLLSRGRRAAANRAIEDTVGVLRSSGLAIKTRIVTGHAAEAIPKLAQRSRCDVLVMGSRGLTGMTALALGSVSLAVAQSAPCPLLVVKRSV